ncbi:MAG: glycosyltransferase [Candidatus Paceibacterota bacterium]
MKILMICKYPPIQGGVSAECYWTAQFLSELNHEVRVLTNANEVESEYRINLQSEDKELLSGFKKDNSIKVISTKKDENHLFIPQVNPTVSKLLGLGLDEIRNEKPDFIWSSYLEPYGVVAYLLSKITGVPYTFRHAGSDIGRLMLTGQLESIHQEVLRNASLIMTRESHHERFTKLGISKDNLIDSIPTRLQPQLFYPSKLPTNQELILGVYGKTGKSKGSGALVEALSLLKKKDSKVKVRAHWGGKHLPRYRNKVRKLGLEDTIQINGFIPHWRIPDFIRSCHAILFLENCFSISFHQPLVPLEALSCGRPIITTEEIANKPLYRELLVNNRNAFVIEGKVTAKSVAESIKKAEKSLTLNEGEQTFATPKLGKNKIHMRIRMYELLQKIKSRTKKEET